MGVKEAREKRLTWIREVGGDEAVAFVLLLRDCFMEGLAKDSSDEDKANMRVAEAYATLVREGRLGLEAPDLYPSFMNRSGEKTILQYHRHDALSESIYEYMNTFHARPVARGNFDKGMRAVLENAAEILHLDYPKRRAF